MDVSKRVIKEGNGTDKPSKGDQVIIEYTGNLYDPSVGPEKDFRGEQYVQRMPDLPCTSLARSSSDQGFPIYRFDSSEGRGPFETQIGVGEVIQGASDLYASGDVATS